MKLTHCLQCNRLLREKQRTFCSIKCANASRAGKAVYVRTGWVEKFMKDLRIDSLTLPAQPNICVHFGCGRTLTRQEELCGSKCEVHMGCVKADPTKHVNI